MALTTSIEPLASPRPDNKRPTGRWRISWTAQWPLTLLFLAFPLWWAMGLSGVMPLLVAVPMALHLTRMRVVYVPRGFGWWLLFLVWVVLGVAVLSANAPDAIPGGGGTNRLIVFAFRLVWYLACTVVLLWVGNLSRKVLPDERVYYLVGTLFVVTVFGGLLGYFEPTLQFRSAIEYLLPAGIRHNAFVASLVHPEVADIETVLGRPEPRPKAPFAFANSWGSGLSLSLVFFVAMLRNATRRTQLAAVGLACAAAIPVLYSLDRGLWASLAVSVVGVVLLLLVKGRPLPFLAMITAVVVAIAILMATPLGGIYEQRLQHQHSNERRGQLLTQTSQSVTDGSPVVGFGNTRNVQGSFASISGARTPDCPGCGVPPLGTQGQLWMVLFTQGWFGLAFFLLFLGLALARCWRCRTPNEVLCTFAIAFFLMQLAVYDSLGIPMFMVMIAIGLVWREQREDAPLRMPHTHRTLASIRQEIRGAWRVLVALALLGGTIGTVGALATTSPAYSSKVAIALTPVPVYLNTGIPTSGVSASVIAASKPPRDITIDTEAALLLSQNSLVPASAKTGTTAARLRTSISVSAIPSTHVLDVSVQARRPAQAAAESIAVADAYLTTRRTYLDQRRTRLLTHLQDQLQNLVGVGSSVSNSRTYLSTAIEQLLTTGTSVGEVIRTAPPKAVPRQFEVPGTSGVALGVLFGATWMALRPRRRRYGSAYISHPATA